MTYFQPAEVRAEPSEVAGMTFIDAAGRFCVWPISGSGALMVVCGARRAAPGCAYCADHIRAAGRSGPRP